MGNPLIDEIFGSFLGSENDRGQAGAMLSCLRQKKATLRFTIPEISVNTSQRESTRAINLCLLSLLLYNQVAVAGFT